MANKKSKHKKPQARDDYKPPFSEELLNQPLSFLNLREDTVNLLSGAGVQTVRDVVKREEKDFYRILKFNKKNLIDVKTALKEKKLFIKPTPEKKPEVPQENKNPVEQTTSEGASQNGKQTVKNGNKGNQNVHNENRKPDKNKNQNQNQNGKKQEKVKDLKTDNAQFVMSTHPPKPPRPKVQPVKEIPDIYVKISRGGKWGFKDRNGKPVVEPVYDEVFSYKEDLCCVEREEKFGFINRNGEIVVPIEYDCATSFSEGFACVFKKEKCGYIDAKNSVVVDFKFDAGTAVINGECRIKKDGKWGEMHLYRDDDGEVAVSDIRWIT